jgi:hypothetical protein
MEDREACWRRVDMASIAYHAPSRATSFQLSVKARRDVALLIISVALFLGGLGVALALQGSHADRTPSLIPAPTQTAP